MHFFQIEDRRYAQFEGLRAVNGLVHAFSTRPMNVAPRDGGDVGARERNRRRMVVDFGLDPEALRYARQVHQTQVLVIDNDTAAGWLPEGDAVITGAPGVALMTFSADCPLVLVVDPARRVVGLAHASWRCTVGKIVARLIVRMRAAFGCAPAEMWAGIGPGAGVCCYEVQRDVYEAAGDLPGREECFVRRDERLYFDLWTANRVQLLAAGVPRERIELAGVCTMCRNDLFYSFRREGAGCGHFGLLAGLRPP